MVEKKLSLIERLRGVAKFETDRTTLLTNFAYSASPGTSLFGGQFQEEYVSDLKGQKAAIVYDKMRRGDPQIQMILNALANPILSATWRILPYSPRGGEDGGADYAKQAEFCQWALFEDLRGGFDCFLEEVFTNLAFGFSLFWKIHKSGNSRYFGNYTGFDRLVNIAQKSVHSWEVDSITGDLVKVRQQADGDTARFVDLPAEFCFLFPLFRQGINYEGVSPIRSAYGSWFRKKNYLMLEAVGAQRGAVGFPKITVPKGIAPEDPERAAMAAIAEAVATNAKQYVMIPEGWGFEMTPAAFDPDTFQGMLRKEDDAMARAILANFLNLGQGGSGGAYALGQDLSDFFLSGLTRIVNQVLAVLNREVLPELVELNFGPQDGYPYFQVSGINDKASKEYAESLAVLKNANLLSWSDRDEAQLRERFALAEAEAERTEPASAAGPFSGLFGSQPPAGAPKGGDDEPPEDPEPEPKDSGDDPEDDSKDPPEPDNPKLSEPVKFAKKSKPQSLMEKAAEGLVDLMRSNLRYMKDRAIDDLVRGYESAPETGRAKVASRLEMQGVSKYAAALKASLVNIATLAFNQVAEENKVLAGLKFSIKYADPLKINEGFKIRDFKRLKPHVRDGLEAQAKLIAETQAADLQKALAFQYTSSLTTAAGSSILIQDLEEAGAKVIDSAQIASIVSASKLVNETRHYFFFDPDVLEKIESFTFRNPSPVTTICQELNGRTFLKSDAESLRYEPPLHYNCKSYLEANEVESGAADAAKEDGTLGLSPTKAAEKQITLSEGRCPGCQDLGSFSQVAHKLWIEPVYPEMPGIVEVVDAAGEVVKADFLSKYEGVELCKREALVASTIRTVATGNGAEKITFGQRIKETLCQVLGDYESYQVGSEFFEAVSEAVGDQKFKVEKVGPDFVATFADPKTFKGGSIRLERRGKLRITWGRK